MRRSITIARGIVSVLLLTSVLALPARSAPGREDDKKRGSMSDFDFYQEEVYHADNGFGFKFEDLVDLLYGGDAEERPAIVDSSIPEARGAAPGEANACANGKNYTRGNRDAADIDGIVLHTIYSPNSALQIDAWRNNSGGSRCTSIHFYVLRDGTIHQLLDPKHIAWQAGDPAGIWNPRSIGIECQASDPADVWRVEWIYPDGEPTPQFLSLARLVRWLCQTYTVHRWHWPTSSTAVNQVVNPPQGQAGIIGHNQIKPASIFAGNGRLDPKDFPWDTFVNAINVPPAPTGLTPGDLHSPGDTFADPFLVAELSWNRLRMSDRDFGVHAPTEYEAKFGFYDLVAASWIDIEPTLLYGGSTAAAYQFPRAGEYSWKVRARNAWGWGAWSPRHHFRIVFGPPSPSVVLDLSTDRNQPTILRSPVVIQWSSQLHEGVTDYEVVIRRYDTTSRTWVEIPIGVAGQRPIQAAPATSYLVPVTGTVPGLYVVSVRAFNGFAWGAWSTRVYYRIP